MAIVTLSALSACGGGGDTHTLLEGRVTEQGAVVANADVVLMNRRTDEGFTTSTDEQGRYSITLPNGHYDMGSDDGERQDVSILGLLTLNGGRVTRDIALEAGGADDISGRIRLANGEPAEGHVLWIKSTEATRQTEGFTEVAQTDAQGRFTATVGEARQFDIDVRDPQGRLIEFVDVHKLDGHLAVDLTLGDQTQANLLRHNASRPPSTAAVAGVAVAAEGGDQGFNVDVSADDAVVLSGGVLTPRAEGVQRNLVLKESGLRDPLATYSGLRPGAGAGEMEVWLDDTTSWFHRYRININVDAVASGALTYNWYGFRDESGDTYHLSAYTTGWHDVKYSSDQPNINAVSIEGSFDIQPVVFGLSLFSGAQAAEDLAEQSFDELLAQAEGLDPQIGARLSAIADEAALEVEEGPVGRAASQAANLNEAEKVSALDQELLDHKVPPDILDPDFDTSQLTDEFFDNHPEYDKTMTEYARVAVEAQERDMAEQPKFWQQAIKNAKKWARPDWKAYKALGLSDSEATQRIWLNRDLKIYSTGL
jgi:hypothetical protein